MDANVVHFPNIFGTNEDEPLDLKGAQAAFRALAKAEEAAKGRTIKDLVYGFALVANEAMCCPIWNLT